jgi:plastocyanin
MKGVHALVLVAALSLIAAACGDDSGTPTTAATTVATTVASTSTTAGAATTTTAGTATTVPSGGSQEVVIIAVGGAYDPDQVTIKAGQEVVVTFTDNDTGADEPHNIHFQIGDSHYFTPINTSAPSTETLTFTVDTPGEYPYWCDTHPTELTGTLIVEP